MKKLLVFALLVCFFIPDLSLAQVFLPIPVKGFNKDLIANGAIGSGELTSISSKEGIDGEAPYGRVLYEKGFSWGTVKGKYGLPVNGLITSNGFPGVNYQFSSYTGNNALKLRPDSSGTLTLLTPGIFSKISVLATMGGPGPSSYGNFTAYLNYSDGTKDSSTFIVPDWYNASPRDTSVCRIALGGSVNGVSTGLGRILFDGTWDDASSRPLLFDNLFTVKSKNKILQSITFKEAAADGGGYRIAIFAICGVTVEGSPVSKVGFPITTTSDITQTSFKANWAALPEVIGYNIDVSTDPNFTSYVGQYNNFELGNVTNLNVTGLVTNTVYYYRLRARNDIGQGPNSTVMNLITLSTGVLAPTALQYPSSKVLMLDSAIQDIAPTVTGGTPVTYSINPGLPTGLDFNTSTGKISGTPIKLSSSTNYTVTAFNGGGNVQATINVSVVTPSITLKDSLKVFSSCNPNAPSDTQSIRVEGLYLLDSVTVTSPTGYEISSNGTSYFSTLKLAPTNGTLSVTKIFVRLKIGATNGASGNITFTSPGVTNKNLTTGSAKVSTGPGKPVISWDGSQLSTASTAGIKYQWILDNNNVTNATASTYKPTATGLYYVQVLDSLSGCKALSDSFRINVTAVLNRGSNNSTLNVYPNPASNQLMIHLSKAPTSSTRIEIFTIGGMLIKTYNTLRQLNVLDVSTILEGNYILKISNKEGMLVKKILIKK